MLFIVKDIIKDSVIFILCRLMGFRAESVLDQCRLTKYTADTSFFILLKNRDKI